MNDAASLTLDRENELRIGAGEHLQQDRGADDKCVIASTVLEEAYMSIHKSIRDAPGRSQQWMEDKVDRLDHVSESFQRTHYLKIIYCR